MIRTKDLVLFVVVIVFLTTGIFVTYAKNYLDSRNLENQEPNWNINEDEVSYTAISGDSGSLNREDNIARLKEKIAENVEIYAYKPSDSSVVSPPALQSGEEHTINQCGSSDNSLVLSQNWPISNVSIVTDPFMRKVIEITTVATTSGNNATTGVVIVPKTVSKTLLELPLNPVKSNSSFCVNNVVGVSLAGTLIFNSDAVLYRSSGSGDLIGYALDGHPIYGLYSGDVDECGGYDVGGTYRYVVTPSDSHIISCHVSAPQALSI